MRLTVTIEDIAGLAKPQSPSTLLGVKEAPEHQIAAAQEMLDEYADAPFGGTLTERLDIVLRALVNKRDKAESELAELRKVTSADKELLTVKLDEAVTQLAEISAELAKVINERNALKAELSAMPRPTEWRFPQLGEKAELLPYIKDDPAAPKNVAGLEPGKTVDVIASSGLWDYSKTPGEQIPAATVRINECDWLVPARCLKLVK